MNSSRLFMENGLPRILCHRYAATSLALRRTPALPCGLQPGLFRVSPLARLGLLTFRCFFFLSGAGFVRAWQSAREAPRPPRERVGFFRAWQSAREAPRPPGDRFGFFREGQSAGRPLAPPERIVFSANGNGLGRPLAVQRNALVFSRMAIGSGDPSPSSCSTRFQQY